MQAEDYDSTTCWCVLYFQSIYFQVNRYFKLTWIYDKIQGIDIALQQFTKKIILDWHNFSAQPDFNAFTMRSNVYVTPQQSQIWEACTRAG